MDPDGSYVLFAAGVDAKGQPCEEKPQRIRPDGVAYPVEGLPGLTSVRRARTGTRFAPKRSDRTARSQVKAPMPSPTTDSDREGIRFAVAAVHDADSLGSPLNRE